MKVSAPSADEFTTLTVRLTADLRARVERWAALHGESSAQAIRRILSTEARDAPGVGLVIQPPTKFMLAHVRGMADPYRMVDGILVDRNPFVDTAWASEPDQWVLVRIAALGKADFEAADRLLHETAGQGVAVYAYQEFCRIPTGSLHILAEAFRGNERALILHHLESGRGTYLVPAPAMEWED